MAALPSELLAVGHRQEATMHPIDDAGYPDPQPGELEAIQAEDRRKESRRRAA